MHLLLLLLGNTTTTTTHNRRTKMAAARPACQVSNQARLWSGLSYIVAAVSSFYTRCQSWIICCRVKTATLTLASPPPLCLPGPHGLAPSCVLMLKHECANEAPCCFIAPPLQCSAFMCRGSISASAAVTVGAVSSASSLHQPRQHHSTLESLHFCQAAQQLYRILPSSLHESHETAAVASHSGLICLPLPPLLPSWVCRGNCPHLPSSSPSSAL